MSSKAKKEDGVIQWSVLIILVAVVMALGLLTIWLVCGNEIPGKGAFGDAFGATNTLFSGLAAALFFFAIFMQRQDLAFTKKMLADSAEAQQQSADSHTESLKELKKHNAHMLQQNAVMRTQNRLAKLQAEIDIVSSLSENVDSISADGLPDGFKRNPGALKRALFQRLYQLKSNVENLDA